MAVFGYGSLAFGVFIVIILLYHKKMNEITKKIVYFLLSTMVVALTVYLIISTLHLNIISDTKGPVHWHADFEIWVCGSEIKIAEPKGFSNRQGTSLVHAHNDNRMHVEGVLVNKKSASLGSFFDELGGYMGGDSLILRVPAEQGLISIYYDDKCNEQPASLYVFVNGNLINNPSDYVISAYETVPPGDRIKIVFTEKPIEEIDHYILGDACRNGGCV